MAYCSDMLHQGIDPSKVAPKKPPKKLKRGFFDSQPRKRRTSGVARLLYLCLVILNALFVMSRLRASVLAMIQLPR